jgi:hypothetical protein
MEPVEWLDSVHVGKKDAPFLERIFSFYQFPRGPVLDVACNVRRLWHRFNRCLLPGPLLCSDSDPAVGPDYVADWNNLPYPAHYAAAVVWDPPHFPNKGGTSRWQAEYQRRYGLGSLPAACAHSVASIFPPALREFQRVLKPKGVLLVKLCDGITGRHRECPLQPLLNAAGESAEPWSLVDVLVKVRPAGQRSARWKKFTHARLRHTWWVVLRQGNTDELRR